MEELEETILRRIRQSMATRHMTQGELGAVLGLKQYQISRMLSGKPFFSIDQLVQIANALDISFYYLVGLQEESYRELSPEAAKIAQAYELADPAVQAVIERILDAQ